MKKVVLIMITDCEGAPAGGLCDLEVLKGGTTDEQRLAKLTEKTLSKSDPSSKLDSDLQQATLDSSAWISQYPCQVEIIGVVDFYVDPA